MTESKGLQNLKAYLESLKDIRVKSVVASMINVKPIKDVLEYIKSSGWLKWDVVGYDRKGKPFHSKDIRILGSKPNEIIYGDSEEIVTEAKR